MDAQDTDERFGWVDITATDSRCQVRLSGEISYELRPTLDAAADEVLKLRLPVEVDLGEVSFIDSSGVGFLARLGASDPGNVRVVNAHSFTRKVLDLNGMPKLLYVDATSTGTDSTPPVTTSTDD